MAKLDWHTYPGADEVARAAADFIAEQAAAALQARGRFRIVLAGGRTPEAAYRLLRAAQQPWSAWEVYFGDERCLAAEDVERNSQMAARALLDLVPIPADQVHIIPAEAGAAAASTAYAPIVAKGAPFDLVLLGVGEDGHTASLFPGQALDRTAWTVAITDAPKAPRERVSLGLRGLRATRALLVLACGAGKRGAIAAWRAQEALPITEVTDGADGRVLLDCDADPSR